MALLVLSVNQRSNDRVVLFHDSTSLQVVPEDTVCGLHPMNARSAQSALIVNCGGNLLRSTIATVGPQVQGGGFVCANRHRFALGQPTVALEHDSVPSRFQIVKNVRAIIFNPLFVFANAYPQGRLAEVSLLAAGHSNAP